MINFRGENQKGRTKRGHSYFESPPSRVFRLNFGKHPEAKASGLLTPGLRSAKVVPPHHPSIGRAGRRSGPGRAKKSIGSGVPREGIRRLRSGLGLNVNLSGAKGDDPNPLHERGNFEILNFQFSIKKVDSVR